MLDLDPKTTWNDQVKRTVPLQKEAMEDQGVDELFDTQETIDDGSSTDEQPDEGGAGANSPGLDDYDDLLNDFNNEQLNPDVDTLFEEDGDVHVHVDTHASVEQRAPAEAIGRIPPMPRRYYSQEGNQPKTHSGSCTSDISSDRSSDEESLYSHASVGDIDAGSLSVVGGLEIANDPDNPRTRTSNTPLPLDLNKIDNGDGSAPKSAIEVPIGSATFRKTLREYILDPAVLEKLEREFDKLNDRKNEVAFAAFGHYKEAAAQKRALENFLDAARSSGGELRRIRMEQEYMGMKDSNKDHILQGVKNEEEKEIIKAAMQNDELEESVVVRPNDDDVEDESAPRTGDFHSEDGLDLSDEHAHDQTPGRHNARDSVYSLDKPLPAIPHEAAHQTLVSMHILLRLLPIKITLIEQTKLVEPDPNKVEIVCERANEVCDFATEHKAPGALQGRCAFYMGLAEYMRSKVESESDAIHVAVGYFDNAKSLCKGVYEEGSWGKEWAWALKREEMSPAKKEAEEEVEKAARTGSGEGGVDSVMSRLWQGMESVGSFMNGKGALSGSLKQEEKRVPRNGSASSSSSFGDRFAAGKGRKLDVPQEAAASAVSADEMKQVSRKGSGSSSFGGCFVAGQGQKLELPEKVAKSEDDEEQVPNNVFGGLVLVADLPQALPKSKKKSGDLRVDAGGDNVIAKNSLLSRVHGVFDPPERYAKGSGNSPTSPAMIIDAEVHSSVSGHSPFTEVPPTASNRGLGMTNSDPPSTRNTADSKSSELPGPVTTASSPATSPTSIISSIGRRLPNFAISPTSDTSAHSPGLATSLEDDETESAQVKPLSIAERRRRSVANFIPWKRTSFNKPQDWLDEAEKGNSPVRNGFDIDSGNGDRKVAKSLLSLPGSEGSADGQGRRKKSGKTGSAEDMV